MYPDWLKVAPHHGTIHLICTINPTLEFKVPYLFSCGVFMFQIVTSLVLAGVYISCLYPAPLIQ